MPNTAKEYAQSFMMHRGALLELLEKIPANKADFAPWEEAATPSVEREEADGTIASTERKQGRSFTQLTDHLANTSNNLVAIIAGQKPERLEPSPDFPAALNRLKTLSQTVHTSVEGLDAAKLSAEVPAFGRTMPLYAMIDFLTQHEAHHKGQIWLMARMIGIEPPMFVKMG